MLSVWVAIKILLVFQNVIICLGTCEWVLVCNTNGWMEPLCTTPLLKAMYLYLVAFGPIQ